MATEAARSLWDKAAGVGRGAKRGAAAFVVFSIGSSLYAQWRAFKEYVTLPPAFYLELDLEQQVLVERASTNPLSLLTSGLHQLELGMLLQVLHTAKNDERVRGLLAVLGGRENFGGLAQLQELRNALLDFRFHAKGRSPLFAYSNVFGEGGLNATGLYYLASAADKVFMPPTSCLSLLGFESTQLFVRGLLDKLHVAPEVFRREEYKAAMAPYTGSAFDEHQRENLTSVLQSLYDQVVSGITSARRLAPEAVNGAVSASPLLPGVAVRMGLLDGLLYRDQVEQLLVDQLPAQHRKPVFAAATPRSSGGGRPQLLAPRVSFHRYATATAWVKQMETAWGSGSSSAGSKPPQQPQLASAAAGSGSAEPDAPAAAAAAPGLLQAHVQAQQAKAAAAGSGWGAAQKPCVAVVTASGLIMQASSGGAGASGDSLVESHKLVRVLRAFRENPQVKAVVLRISSPGGSAVASDMIAREVALLSQGGVPVVAAIGDVGASGGYYIAAPATKILAQPASITGSIGVIFAKVNLKEAAAQLGITPDSVAAGDNATWASSFHDLTPQQRAQVEGMIDSTYGDFLHAVARGRRMTLEDVRRLAKGRVWTGQQALEAGLVDELGGQTRALELAKQLAGLPEDAAATSIVEWPPRRVPPLVMLLKQAGGLPGSSQDALAAAADGLAGGAAGLAALASLFVGGLVAMRAEAAGPDADVPAVRQPAGGAPLQLAAAAGLSPQEAAAAAALLPAAALAQLAGGVQPTPQLICAEAAALAFSA